MIKYKTLAQSEPIAKGDQYRDTYNGLWCPCQITIGMTVKNAKKKYSSFFGSVRRPITLGKRQTQAANKRSLKRAKTRIKRA